MSEWLMIGGGLYIIIFWAHFIPMFRNVMSGNLVIVQGNRFVSSVIVFFIALLWPLAWAIVIPYRRYKKKLNGPD